MSLCIYNSKSSKLSTSPNSRLPLEKVAEAFEQFLLSQYLYFCTVKASNLVQQVPSSSNLSVSAGAIATAGLCKRLLSAAHSIRQHTSAYVRYVGVSPVATAGICKRLLSVTHHLARFLTKCARKVSQQVRCTALPVAQHTSAYVSIRQHTSAYVRIRQRTSEFARKLWQQERCTALLAAAPSASAFLLLC